MLGENRMPAKFKENKRKRIEGGRELRKLGGTKDYEVRNNQPENELFCMQLEPLLLAAACCCLVHVGIIKACIPPSID